MMRAVRFHSFHNISPNSFPALVERVCVLFIISRIMCYVDVIYKRHSI